MVSLKGKSKGFTIVELLIVIVVIGILATLVIVTFTGIQQKARNSQRQTDINALDSHVEAFYAQNGAYPTLAQLNDSGWRAKYMKGLDSDALLAPGSTTAPSAATSTKSMYQYAPTQDDGTTACSGGDTSTTNDDPNVDTNCTKFVASAFLEGQSTPYSKKSN
jgi:prepilin-type N-terminal cleavage/methylation domain-containing protein